MSFDVLTSQTVWMIIGHGTGPKYMYGTKHVYGLWCNSVIYWSVKQMVVKDNSIGAKNRLKLAEKRSRPNFEG